MMSNRASLLLRGFLVAAISLACGAATAGEEKYGPGISDTEIKIGQTMPYSGPASSLATVGRTAAAYYKMTNDQGGVNGRSINFISLDDGYSPPKTVEQTRRLIEQDQILAIVGSLGAAQNASVQRYLNDRKVPQLFLFSGNARFRDPQGAPWTMGGDLSFANQAQAFARYVLQTMPNARIAVLYQNDDLGKDNLRAFKVGLGDKAVSLIVKEVSFETTDATVDSQIVTLQASGANVLLDVAIPKFTAQAIRKVYDVGWRPLHVIAYPAASIPATLQPAGLGKSTGLVTAEFVKQPGDPAWSDDPDMLAYLAFMKKYNPGADAYDKYNVFGYYNAALAVQMLKQCGDDLTRDNLMYQATHMNGLRIPMLLPGITMSTSPTDYGPIKQMQLQRFNGTKWEPIGGIVGG